MDELMKTLESKEDDGAEQEPEDVIGLLAVHVASIKTVKEDIESSMVDLLQLKVIYQDHTKWFPLSHDTREDAGKIDCCATRHLPIQLPKDSDCPRNWLEIELIIRSPLLVGVWDTVLAKAMLHIHDIVYETPLKGDVELRESPGEVFALISAEFAFGYGMFGYGESCHLHHPVKKPGHFLHHSMFPRLTPSDQRMDTNHMLVPLATQHPSFIPFRQKAFVASHEVSSPVQSCQPQLLISRMTRLNALRAEYEAKKDKQQRLAFLQETVKKKAQDTSQLNIQVTSRKRSS